MADQQPTLVKKEDHPHTTPLFSPRFTEEDVPGDGTQQESASTSVSHFVVNGEKRLFTVYIAIAFNLIVLSLILSLG